MRVVRRSLRIDIAFDKGAWFADLQDIQHHITVERLWHHLNFFFVPATFISMCPALSTTPRKCETSGGSLGPLNQWVHHAVWCLQHVVNRQWDAGQSGWRCVEGVSQQHLDHLSSLIALRLPAGGSQPDRGSWYDETLSKKGNNYLTFGVDMASR